MVFSPRLERRCHVCLSLSAMDRQFSLLEQDAVEAVISILGMSACDGTDAVPPNARSHTVLLSGEPLLFPVEFWSLSPICLQSCCWQLGCRLSLRAQILRRKVLGQYQNLLYCHIPVFSCAGRY